MDTDTPRLTKRMQRVNQRAHTFRDRSKHADKYRARGRSHAE